LGEKEAKGEEKGGVDVTTATNESRLGRRGGVSRCLDSVW
jgi:hypothetical protein